MHTISVPAHEPLTQTSLDVNVSESSQAVPSDRSVSAEHWPPGCKQWPSSLHEDDAAGHTTPIQMSGSKPAHCPAVHSSFCVAPSLSSQIIPSGKSCSAEHTPAVHDPGILHGSDCGQVIPAHGSTGGGGAVTAPPYEITTFSSWKSKPNPFAERPCIPMETVPTAPCATVIWPTTTVGPDGPESGFIQKTAPSVDVIPVVSVQPTKSSPMVLSEPEESPLSMPTLSQESNSENPSAALFATATKAGLIPPTFAPKGVATWYAGGMSIGDVATPKRL